MPRFEGLTKAQTDTLSRIATGDDRFVNERVARALLDKGYIETYREVSGAFSIIRYRVPITVHIRWAAWCATLPD